MLVFIDYSGDAGFKLESGSTRYFIIVAIIFEDDLEAEKVDVEIKEIKRRLRIPENIEFKFNKSQKKVRVEFLKSINKFSFSVRALVIDKKLIKSQHLKDNKDSFYSYAIKMLLRHSHDSILEAKVRIDGSGNRLFRKYFLSYLRRELNSRDRKILKNIKLVNSKSNTLIQMADMVAGSIKRFYEEISDSGIYKPIIQRHIVDEWKFK